MFSDLVGKVLEKVVVGERTIDFYTTDGKRYLMYHDQDCCEQVSIESIDGDIQRLVGQEVLEASESSNQGNVSDWGDTCTWTFYILRTNLDSVTIRWYGSSNGYYSESVSFAEADEEGRPNWYDKYPQ